MNNRNDAGRSYYGVITVLCCDEIWQTLFFNLCSAVRLTTPQSTNILRSYAQYQKHGQWEEEGGSEMERNHWWSSINSRQNYRVLNKFKKSKQISNI
jgi:hypothetical protein